MKQKAKVKEESNKIDIRIARTTRNILRTYKKKLEHNRGGENLTYGEVILWLLDRDLMLTLTHEKLDELGIKIKIDKEFEERKKQ